MKEGFALRYFKLSALSVFLLMILCVFFISPAYSEKPASPLRVLFIGNSYIYVNDLPTVLTNIAKSANPKINIKTIDITKGGL